MAAAAAAFRVAPAPRPGVGRKGDGVEGLEPVLDPVQIGDALDRPAALRIVAVIAGVQVREHVAAAAARKRVDACASIERIVAFIALQAVGVWPATDHVDRVVAEATEYGAGPEQRDGDVRVVALVAEHDVAAAFVDDGIAAEAADHRVVALVGDERIVATVAEDEVGSGAGHDEIAAVRRIVAAEDREGAAAVSEIDRVCAFVAEIPNVVLGPMVAPERVVAETAENRIVAAVDHDRVVPLVGEDEIVECVSRV